jgi:hypothetical protein
MPYFRTLLRTASRDRLRITCSLVITLSIALPTKSRLPCDWSLRLWISTKWSTLLYFVNVATLQFLPCTRKSSRTNHTKPILCPNPRQDNTHFYACASLPALQPSQFGQLGPITNITWLDPALSSPGGGSGNLTCKEIFFWLRRRWLTSHLWWSVPIYPC